MASGGEVESKGVLPWYWGLSIILRRRTLAAPSFGTAWSTFQNSLTTAYKLPGAQDHSGQYGTLPLLDCTATATDFNCHFTAELKNNATAKLLAQATLHFSIFQNTALTLEITLQCTAGGNVHCTAQQSCSMLCKAQCHAVREVATRQIPIHISSDNSASAAAI